MADVTDITTEILISIRDEIIIMRTDFTGEIRTLRRDVNHRLEAVEHRLESVEHRLESVDDRLESVDDRLESVDDRLESVDHRLESVDGRLASVERDMSEVTGLVRDGSVQTAQLAVAVRSLDQRVTALEQRES